jgi:hypothetical protein
VFILAVLAIAASLVSGWLIARSIVSTARAESPFTQQWRERVARDYPEWKVVRFQVVNTDSGSGPGTYYWATLMTPGQKNTLSVYYLSAKGGPAVSQDEVFRSDGTFHQWAPKLLTYLNDHYYSKGLAITSVTSDSDGAAYVTWQKPGDTSTSATHVDALTIETVDGTWSLLP